MTTVNDDRPPYRDPALPLEERLADLLARMTLEEKVAQLYCVGRVVEMGGIIFDEEGRLLPERLRAHYPHGLCQIGRPSQGRWPRDAAVITNGIQRYLAEETRLGIPALFNEEGLHGLMGKGATSFPQAIALASSWDEELVEAVYTAVARETRARGSNYIYAPVLDLARDPRWGRVEETFGEDPYLVSRLGVAAVRGLQGRDGRVGPGRVIAAAKHFAVHGQPEGGLNSAPGNISERVIREEFLPPFHAAIVEAGAHAVMASYNEIDGVPAHVNPWLLRKVLREEWGFRGMVTSDGQGVTQLLTLHHAAVSEAEAARRAVEAGVDVEVPRGHCYPTLLEQAREGRVAMATIDRAVAGVLRCKLLLGLLDATPQADPDEAERLAGCEEHRRLARRAAHRSAVLLKNEGGLLPLDPAALRAVAVIGPNAADLHLGGYAEDPGRGAGVYEGIARRLAGRATVSYAEGCRITEGPQGYAAWHAHEVVASDPADDTPRIAAAVELARRSDLVILVLGENEGTCREGWWFNHLGDRDDLRLLGRQDELAAAVLATGVPTVVLLFGGRPLAIGELAASAPAILECWYLGEETGDAVADLLFGAVSPGGKLPVSFPRSVGQLPVYYNHRPSAKRGYLFSDTTPLFPFGHGLSYTSFAYSGLRLEPARIRAGETTRALVEVTNTGERAGDEVVQLYVRDQVSSVTRPVQALKGFRRLTLAPGETATVEFPLGPDALGLLDMEMAWRVEPGLFEIMAGGSSVGCASVTLEVTA